MRCDILGAMNEPTKTQYSRDEILDKLREWMLEEIGKPMDMEPEQKENWYRDYGMMAHFLMDNFPQ